MKRITVIIERWLAVVILGTLAVGLLISILYLNHKALKDTEVLLEQTITDCQEYIWGQVLGMARDDAVIYAGMMDKKLETDLEEEAINEYLAKAVDLNEISEFSFINEEGVITYSSDPERIGCHMMDDETSAGFTSLLKGEPYFIQQMKELEPDDTGIMYYSGAPFPNRKGFLLVGKGTDTVFDYLQIWYPDEIEFRRINQEGSLLFVDPDRQILGSLQGEHNGEVLDETVLLDPSAGLQKADLFGTSWFVLVRNEEPFYIVSMYPESAAFASARTTITVVVLIDVTIFAILFLVISLVVRKKVVKGIYRLNESLSAITAGNLDEKADVRNSVEFNSLSDGINTTVDALKDHIERESARIDQELAFARSIQLSALPSVFPPYPDRMDFDLHACMYTAKEVGGDFYDFYLLDKKHLAFLIADVSGKGIPAAMFMMTGKTVIRGYAESGIPLADAITKANNKLCEGNDAEMFITAWMGILETDTGLVRFVDAGHNAPVLIRDGKAEYIDQKHNLILAMMEGVKYREQRLLLQPGDMLFLYTDGVTEAKCGEKQFFGEDRLLEILSGLQAKDLSEKGACEEICRRVKKEIDRFVQGTAQFDDITMLCLKYGK